MRYLPAEIAGTLAALAAAWSVHAASGSLISAAIAGTISESLGYYGCMAVRAALHYDACHRHLAAPQRHWLTGIRTVRDMLVEFGPAELVDSLLVRPFSMYLMTGLLGDFTAGIVAGKLAADVVFYGIAITAYELRKRYLPLPRPRREHRIADRRRAVRGLHALDPVDASRTHRARLSDALPADGPRSGRPAGVPAA